MTNCPFCNSTEIRLEKETPVGQISKSYKKILGVSVDRFFGQRQTISRYNCRRCGYGFYAPFDTQGDEKFYGELGQLPWYYMADKWEHLVSLDFIKKEDKVLEIGCGKGAFLQSLKNKGIFAEGIELNKNAIEQIRSRGLTVYEQTIQDFSNSKKEYYDVVCSYQVLEHIVDPESFLSSSLSTLKSGGLLIIAVPNNESFIEEDKFPILNMPPHHFGLYSEKTLRHLEKILPIKTLKIFLEPLPKYHFRYYYYTRVGQYLENSLGIFGKIANRVLYYLYYPVIALTVDKIIGHTIMAVYKKN